MKSVSLQKLLRRWKSVRIRAIASSLNIDPISTEMRLIKMVDYDNWSPQIDAVSGSRISKDLDGLAVQPDAGQV
jgi:hypothetical protein